MMAPKTKTIISTISTLTLLLFLTGCSASSFMSDTYYVADYDISLSSVERPLDATQRYGKQTISKYNPVDSSKYKYLYEDGLVKILWFVTEKGFYFSLNNNTKNSIKIIWDEAAYMDVANKSHRIMHTGVKYDERDNPQPPSIVVRGGAIDEFIAPTDLVYFYRGYGSQYIYDPSEWRHKPIIPNRDKVKSVTLKYAENFVGNKINLLLPLEIKGVTNEYLFEFTINSYNITKKDMLLY